MIGRRSEASTIMASAFRHATTKDKAWDYLAA
jgi:hypothetical protein